MKKVLFVSMFAYPLFNKDFQDKFGGAEIQMSFLARELALDGSFDVHFAVLDMGQKDGETIEGIKFHKAYKRGKNLLNLISAPIKLFGLVYKANPDVIICRAAGPEVGVCAFASKILKKKMIYSIAHNKDVNGDRFKGVSGMMFEYGLKRANWLVAQSFDQVYSLKDHYKKDIKKISVIKNSFNIKKEGDLKDKKYILWVGRAVDFKRPEIFISLAKDNPEERFVMVIAKGGRPYIWEKMRMEAENVDNLKLVGDVPFSEIDDYFSKAKIFVNTSTAEGFPNTFLQAANYHTPILSLNVNPDGFIDANNCGLVCHDDYSELNNGLKNLLKDGGLYEKMSNNVFEYLKKEHSLATNIEKWKEVINKL